MKTVEEVVIEMLTELKQRYEFIDLDYDVEGMMNVLYHEHTLYESDDATEDVMSLIKKAFEDFEYDIKMNM